jgi:hypothetical protein
MHGRGKDTSQTEAILIPTFRSEFASDVFRGWPRKKGLHVRNIRHAQNINFKNGDRLQER